MSISDIIEKYIKEILQEQEQRTVEIKRNEMADHFECVPSQINYVINTRFTSEKGYLIESKRGGGGYIRITRVEHQKDAHLLDEIIEMTRMGVSQQAAEHILERLLIEEVITEREERLIMSAIDRETLNLQLPERDQLRGRILTRILTTLKYIK